MSWRRCRLDWLTTEERGAVNPTEISADTVFHYSIPALDEFGDGRLEPPDEIGSGKFLLSGGEVLISKLNPRLPRVLLAEAHDVPTLASTEFIALRPGPDVDERFLRYWLGSEPLRQMLNGATMSVTRSQQRVRPEILTKSWLTLPSIDEQRAIADYLDQETARIDALIEKKQRMIDILHHRLDVVVIDLTGCDRRSQQSAPPGWTRCRLKHLTKVERGRFTHRPRNDPDFYGGDYPFVQTGDIRSAQTYITEIKQSLNERGRAVSRSFPSGTVLMGIAANVGDVAITSFETWCPDSIVGFLPRLGIGSDYLYFLLKGLRSYIGETSTENTQENTNIDRLGDLVVLLPSFDIQTAVVSDLQRLEATVQRLSAVLTAQINLLHEHRQALITAAVTGALEIPEVAA